MKKVDYLKLIRQVYEEVIEEYKTDQDKNSFRKILTSITEILMQIDDNPKIIFENLITPYLNSIKAIDKLSPGLSTGLYDEQDNIIINTYNGKMSDIPTDSPITEDVVFDTSSMTKMFTAILLLKESERGNVDLNKKFKDYCPLLKSIDIPIIEALKFNTDLKTDGRVDEPKITVEERKRRFKNVNITERDTYIYSDIPYMLVPLLFGENLEEATENYIDKFYSFYRDELGLTKTGYSQINMTGGTIIASLNEERITYTKDSLYDPKAKIFEREVGYVSGHAGVTTTTTDLEKLFSYLTHGLLTKESLKILTTTIRPNENILLNKDGTPVLRNGKEIKINHAMGIYVNKGTLALSHIPARYSSSSFAAQGSSGTYSIFDIENRLNMTYLSNIKSGLYHKYINTEEYTYGYENDEIPKNIETTIISGTGTPKDGQILRPDGTFMPHIRATNNFKEESLETLLKLRIVKRILMKKIEAEYDETKKQQKLEEIEKTFKVVYHNPK